MLGGRYSKFSVDFVYEVTRKSRTHYTIRASAYRSSGVIDSGIPKSGMGTSQKLCRRMRRK